MTGLIARGIVLLITGLVAAAPLARAGEPTQLEREAMYYRYLEFPSYVKGGSIEPHWMADGSSFWYANGAPALQQSPGAAARCQTTASRCWLPDRLSR